MKAKIFISLFISILLLTGTIYTGVLLTRYYSFTDEIATPQRYKNSEGDSLRVIFIGDSWAAYHSQFDQHLKICIESKINIKERLSAGIKPIIIDMPHVDYRAIYQRESIIARIRHRISSWYTGAPLWTFDDYRETLQSLISQGEMKKQLIYIPATNWNPDGYKDSRMLYKEDHVHLNDKGYFLLDSCIASYIYEDYKITHDFQ